MNILVNIFKYTVCLPILLVISASLIVSIIIAFIFDIIFNLNMCDDILSLLGDIWRPICWD